MRLDEECLDLEKKHTIQESQNNARSYNLRAEIMVFNKRGIELDKHRL